MRTALKRLLENNQYVVDSVSDGWSALRYAETAEYDGLILDIAMPGVDGLEVLRQLRSQGVSTPALFLTAMAKSPSGWRGWTPARTTTSPSPAPPRSCCPGAGYAPPQGELPAGFADGGRPYPEPFHL